jgi:hypothetical protein
VGVVLEGRSGPRWVGSVLRALRESGAEIVALGAPSNGARPPWLRRLYERWDAALFRPDEDPAAVESFDGLIGPLEPVRAGQPVDVTIDLRGGPPDAAPSAAHGTWRFRLGDPDVLRELMERSRVSSIALIRDGASPAGFTPGYTHVAASDPTSLVQTISELQWKASSLAARLVSDLGMHGRPEHARELPAASPEATAGEPSGAAVVRYLSALPWTLARSKLAHRLMREEWEVGFRVCAEAGDGLVTTRLSDYTTLPSPPGRYFADPFPFSNGDRDYIFFEDYSYAAARGRIGFVEVDADGNAGAPCVALERDHHLSYPFMFEHDGSVFMIPETLEARRIELYRAERFPSDWRLERVLVDDVAAVDATLLDYAGRLWLFAAVEPDRGSRFDQLFVYHSDRLAGPWRAHRGNPVKTDARSSRPAGGFFRSGGRLVRPSQDGTSGYGGAIRFCEVTTLSETGFDEREIGHLEAPRGSGLAGVHTINANGRIAVVDWKRMRATLPWSRR